MTTPRRPLRGQRAGAPAPADKKKPPRQSAGEGHSELDGRKCTGRRRHGQGH